MATEQFSEQLKLVMERQCALENALMQEPQARTETEQRLSVALGEVGGLAEVKVQVSSRAVKHPSQTWLLRCLMVSGPVMGQRSLRLSPGALIGESLRQFWMIPAVSSPWMMAWQLLSWILAAASIELYTVFLLILELYKIMLCMVVLLILGLFQFILLPPRRTTFAGTMISRPSQTFLFLNGYGLRRPPVTMTLRTPALFSSPHRLLYLRWNPSDAPPPSVTPITSWRLSLPMKMSFRDEPPTLAPQGAPHANATSPPLTSPCPPLHFTP